MQNITVDFNAMAQEVNDYIAEKYHNVEPEVDKQYKLHAQLRSGSQAFLRQNRLAFAVKVALIQPQQ